jgi:hypothetical protein
VPPSRGALRDRYRIERELGRGGRATVYLGLRGEERFQGITGKPTSSP